MHASTRKLLTGRGIGGVKGWPDRYNTARCLSSYARYRPKSVCGGIR